MPIHDDEFMRHYWAELQYLRRAGESFARSYPKVAARLELQAGECPDPHVERLLEGFAFLTARIQQNLENDYPEIAQQLLDVLYPHYVRPIPSCAIARFEVDPQRGKLTSGFRVPRHTALHTQSTAGAACRFRTCSDLTLWPLEVQAAALETPDAFDFLSREPEVAAVLRIRLSTLAEPFEKLELDRLRFFLNGDALLVGQLYELLLNDTLGLVVWPVEGHGMYRLAPQSVQPVGFADDEAVLPSPGHTHPAHRLLQEYFAFPEKFHFFDLEQLGGKLAGSACDLLFLLGRPPRGRLPVDRENFALFCTPIVNLFQRTTEPLRIDHRRFEHRLVADARREATTEIHTVLSVSGAADPREGPRQYAPFYSWNHAMEHRRQDLFWHERRARSFVPERPGTETHLSFVDQSLQQVQLPVEAVWAEALCTNRRLAEQVPGGASLQTDLAIPVGAIVCLKKPTAQVTPPLDGQTLWRLVSHLSLNYLSLSTGEDGLKALKEILRLYSQSGDPVTQNQIAGVAALAERAVVRRIGSDAWRGLCRGTEVTLTFDEALYIGSGAFLFASVLNRFLGLSATTHSFTQLVIQSRQREGVWKRWPPMAGARIVR